MLISLYFSDKSSEDQPKSPTAAKVDMVPLGSSQQEVERPVGESTAIAQGILGCHFALVVINFCTRVLLFGCRVLCLDLVLLSGSGQTSC